MDRYSLRRITSAEMPSPGIRLFDAGVDEKVAAILLEIRSGGSAALRRRAVQLGELEEGDVAPLLLDASALRAAWLRIDIRVRELLERAHDRIASFAAAQRACLSDLSTAVPGGRAGHDFVPVARAGCYVPGGRYPLPSSALMTVTPAVTAGVKEVWCAGPRPTDITLAAAHIAGASGFLRCGGAQAIGALAFGVEVPPCDVIVGPGGRYVASAKRQLFGLVGTEAPAGPSELLVIADDTADPSVVAADLIAQAEHDSAAVPMLICASEAFTLSVEEALADQLGSLPQPNADTAAEALGNGWVFVESRKPQIIRYAELCAPEHLELHVKNPEPYMEAIHSAGAVFSGHGSAEVFGDYGAGPNHTLPTGGAARFSAGLSVMQFLRARTWLRMDNPAELLMDSAAFARLEGLEGHARAALSRRKTTNAATDSPDADQ